MGVSLLALPSLIICTIIFTQPDIRINPKNLTYHTLIMVSTSTFAAEWVIWNQEKLENFINFVSKFESICWQLQQCYWTIKFHLICQLCTTGKILTNISHYCHCMIMFFFFALANARLPWSEESLSWILLKAVSLSDLIMRWWDDGVFKPVASVDCIYHFLSWFLWDGRSFWFLFIGRRWAVLQVTYHRKRKTKSNKSAWEANEHVNAFPGCKEHYGLKLTMHPRMIERNSRAIQIGINMRKLSSIGSLVKMQLSQELTMHTRIM